MWVVKAVLIATHAILPIAYKPSPYLEDIDKVRNKTILEIEKTSPLQVCGTGGGMMGSIKMVYIAFRHKKYLTQSEARNYVIYCAEKLLFNINEEKKLRPFLNPYPFTGSNVDISLYYKNDKQVFRTCLKGGKITYHARKFDDLRSKVVHEESYEEAFKLVYQQSL